MLRPYCRAAHFLALLIFQRCFPSAPHASHLSSFPFSGATFRVFCLPSHDFSRHNTSQNKYLQSHPEIKRTSTTAYRPNGIPFAIVYRHIQRQEAQQPTGEEGDLPLDPSRSSPGNTSGKRRPHPPVHPLRRFAENLAPPARGVTFCTVLGHSKMKTATTGGAGTGVGRHPIRKVLKMANPKRNGSNQWSRQKAPGRTLKT